MPTSSERKALVFFAAVTLLGGSVRLHRSANRNAAPDPAARAALALQLKAADSARRVKGSRPSKRERKQKQAVPAAGPVDLDVASAEQIEALPWIGPALAKRIVADRDSLGPFGSLDGLDRVKGIGPSMVVRLGPRVTFSLFPRPSNTVISRRSELPRARRKPHRRDQLP
ncbi:MAG TPA: helix-hairpin-helix domain-containing protein [Gemmatimonadaceae bacterium]|nr:helix-hairpin-helix domain-containing protein [Gemmatimonadaceae bacterium]